MPQRPSLAARLRRIPLGDLRRRRGHPYRLPRPVRRSLVARIAALGLYPPLIVRPCPRRAGMFEILDGHQRADALCELGCSTARCEVWPVDDEQVEICAATLNHLRGRAEAAARARQVRRLIRRLGAERVGELLACGPAAIRRQLAALEPPAKLTAEAATMDLHPVTFHLSAADVQTLNDVLRSVSPGCAKRGGRLMAAIRAAGRAASDKE